MEILLEHCFYLVLLNFIAEYEKELDDYFASLPQERRKELIEEWAAQDEREFEEE